MVGFTWEDARHPVELRIGRFRLHPAINSLR